MTSRWAARAVLLMGFLFATGWAGAAPAAQLAYQDPKGPAMWQLRTDNATVYFLGSFHMLPPSVKWRDDKRIDTALAQASDVVFEIDLADMDKPEVAKMIVARATLPGNRTLRDVLTAATYRNLTLAAGKVGVAVDRLDRSQPWLAASGLLVGYMVSQGANPGDGVDSHLTREARAAGKQVIPLETVEEQLTLMETMSREDPDLMIMDMIRFINDDDGLLTRTLNAWQTGDVDTIDAVMREDLDKHAGAYDRFIADRNRAWIPKIDAMIKKGGTYFVVVGAGHLAGDKSVIALLEQQGYAIERY